MYVLTGDLQDDSNSASMHLSGKSFHSLEDSDNEKAPASHCEMYQWL